MNLFNITAIGYCVGLLGFLIGTSLSVLIHKCGNKFPHVLTGFTAGILISFICIEMIPEVLNEYGILISVAGIMSGAIFFMMLENNVTHLHVEQNGQNKAGMAIAFGVMAHKLPEGIALGSLLSIQFATGLPLAFVIALQCIPEALIIALLLMKSGWSRKKLYVFCLFAGASIATGSLLGAAISNISSSLIALCLSFSIGVMACISLGEIIPKSKSASRNVSLLLWEVIGFSLGLIFL